MLLVMLHNNTQYNLRKEAEKRQPERERKKTEEETHTQLL